MLYDTVAFKERFEELVEQKMGEKDRPVRFIHVECDCGWGKKVENESWVSRATLRQECVSHIDEHNDGNYVIPKDPSIVITLYTDEMIDDVDITVN